MSCGTIHWYCQDVPSWKPSLSAGSAGPVNAPAGVAGAEEAGRGVEDLPVVLGAGLVARRVGPVAEVAGHLGEHAVGQGVLQGGRGAVVEVGVAGLGVRPVLDVRGVPVLQVLDVGLAAHGRRVGGRHPVGVLLQGPVRLLLVPLQQTLLVGVGEEGGDRVAGHDVRLDRAVAPLGQPAALRVDAQDGYGHVAGFARGEQREQLRLGAVGVPERPVLVVRERPVRVDSPVLLLVPAGVAAVHVAAHVGREEGPVEGRVEGAAQLVAAALGLHAFEAVLPGAFGGAQDVVEAVAALGTEVERGPLGVHVAEGRGGLDGAVLGGVEAQPGAVAGVGGGGLLRALGDGVAVPGAGGGEGAVEAGDRVDRVRLGVLAEAAAGDGGPHGAVVEDLHLGGERPVQRLARVEQDVGLVGGREGVALDAGALRGGQLGLDAGLEPDLVVAGARLLVVVPELGGVLRVVGLRDVAGGGQRRQVAAESAAHTGEVDGGEAADVVLAVVVTGVVAGVRGELHHAEGHGGAGVGVALVLGADERIDQVGQAAVAPRGGLGRGPGEEDTAQERGGGECGGRAAQSRPWGPMHGVYSLGQRCQSAIILGFGRDPRQGVGRTPCVSVR